MLDLDKYINNSTEIKINGITYHIKQPTVAMIERLDAIQRSTTDENIVEKRTETALLFFNNNEEGTVFTKNDLMAWTQEAVAKVISVMAMLRYEAETDPN